MKKIIFIIIALISVSAYSQVDGYEYLKNKRTGYWDLVIKKSDAGYIVADSLSFITAKGDTIKCKVIMNQDGSRIVLLDSTFVSGYLDVSGQANLKDTIWLGNKADSAYIFDDGGGYATMMSHTNGTQANSFVTAGSNGTYGYAQLSTYSHSIVVNENPAQWDIVLNGKASITDTTMIGVPDDSVYMYAPDGGTFYLERKSDGGNSPNDAHISFGDGTAAIGTLNHSINITESTGRIYASCVENVIGGKFQSTQNSYLGNDATDTTFTSGRLLIGGNTATTSTSQLVIKGPDNAGVTSRTCMTYGNGGYAVPSNINTESNGDKWVLWNTSAFKGAIGFASNEFWFQSTNSAGTGKFSWYQGSSSASLTMRLDAGKLGLGNHTTLNYAISLNGDAAKTIGMERHSTSNTAGNNLTLLGGGATSAATDKNGGMVQITPGVSTGTGFSSVRLQRNSRAASTGTSDNTASDAVVIPSTFNLTDAGNNDLFDISLADAGEIGAGVTIQFTIIAADATDIQTYTGKVVIALANDAGTLYESIVEHDATSDMSTGTLTTAWSIVDGTNKVTVRLVPTSSLTPTTFRCFYTIFNNSSQTITQL